MRVGVVLASVGRPDDLAHVLSHLEAQTHPPSVLALSLERREDAPGRIPSGVEVIYGPKGLCAQRNRGIEALIGRCDVIAFFDDDFVPSRYAIAGIVALFAANEDIVGATGRVLADGVRTGGVPYENARKIVEDFDQDHVERPAAVRDVATAYGCNMAFRASAIADLRFDERLPLYGWQEDVDFAGRIRRRGRMVSTDSFVGVHCGVARARMPGKRLGFSQIINPIYLVRKGTMRRSHALRLMAMNFVANHVRALSPEPHIDRRGRALGNWIALSRLVRGRVDPMEVMGLDSKSSKAAA